MNGESPDVRIRMSAPQRSSGSTVAALPAQVSARIRAGHARTEVACVDKGCRTVARHCVDVGAELEQLTGAGVAVALRT